MEKTYSQKVARAFEIVDYLLLIPSVAGILLTFPVFFTGMSVAFSNGEPGGLALLLFSAFIWTMCFFGCRLMLGYFRHSRGTLDDEYVESLWIKTAVYNAFFLLPTLFFVVLKSISEPKDFSRDLDSVPLPVHWLVAWWGIAIVFSLSALKNVRANAGHNYNQSLKLKI